MFPILINKNVFEPSYKDLRASLVAQTVKNLSLMQETQLSPWVGKIPWRREWLPTPVFLPEESHGLMGYSPWSCKESKTTE